MDELEIARSTSYDVHANWKMVFQDYSECYHCPSLHPDQVLIHRIERLATDGSRVICDWLFHPSQYPILAGAARAVPPF
jgi:phenylpropionate dioxygenase-like ring-hydroxylating dioxygenase large terminal subunit